MEGKRHASKHGGEGWSGLSSALGTLKSLLQCRPVQEGGAITPLYPPLGSHTALGLRWACILIASLY